MIRNYLLAALRNMRRYKVFSLINITGLAIGLSICMVIIMSVAHQMKSDRYNSKADRVYRFYSQRINANGLFGGYATVAMPLAGSLENYSGIEKVVRIRRGFGRHWIGMPDEQHIPLGGFYAGPEFIDLFEYPMVKGDPATALTEPFTVVLTKAAAVKLFGETEPMGQVIDMNEQGEYTVTGILDMDKVSTHIEFEAVASLASAYALENNGIFNTELDNWDNTTSGWVYFEISAGNDPARVSEYIQREAAANMSEDMGVTFELQALKDIKPGPLMGNEIGPFMPWLIVYILGGLGLIIMTSSCFNYINLSVARSMSRSREVGIRKVNGAGKHHVILQFMTESVLLAFFALALALILLLYLEPAFEQLNFSRILRWELSHEIYTWGVIVLFTLITGIIAGFFPSLVMARFQPLQVLKGMRSLKLFSHVGLRKVLIVMQFALSLFFIISIMIFYNQVKMLTESETGYEGENVLLIPYHTDTFDLIRNDLQQQSWTVNISRSSHIPATGRTYAEDLGRTITDAVEGISYFSVDEDYLENMNISLVAGRMLAERLPDEPEDEVVINMEALNHFGFSEPREALGEVLYTSDSNALTIVGIIPDYHHEAMMVLVQPLVLRNLPDRFNYIQVRVSGDKLEQARRETDAIWKKHNDQQIAEIMTVSENIEEFYDLMFGDLISILLIFAVIATIVSCLGLLGIAIYTTELRMKEVSIRKVLGAENAALVFILSWSFLKMVLVATAIAVPLSYLANNFWLSMMATRINLSPWFFVSGTLLLLVTALVTIGSQTLRSLRVNPADSLRNE